MPEWESIGKLLLEYGLTNNDDLREGLEMQKETGIRLGEALVKLGKVSMEDINWALSKQLDIPFVIVENIIANDELLGKFQKKFLIENRILPLHETDDQISIVTEDPFNDAAIDVIRDSVNKKVNISTGSGRKIEELLKNVYQKVALPELIASLESITERIKETSFYRIDFLLGKKSCKINIFGSGILRNITAIQGTFTKEDIFRTFDNLNIPFLYDKSFTDNTIFLATYPLVNRLDITGMPAIIGKYGLYLPDDITFSDTDSYGLSHFFRFDNPVQGYRYFLTKRNTFAFEKSTYVVDAAPIDFKNHYIKVCIPEKCLSCNGTGCQACKDLGYKFSEIEGVYSSGDLNERLKEG